LASSAHNQRLNGGQLASRQLVGMLIVIFVRKSVKPHFTDVKTCASGAGLMGVMVSPPFRNENLGAISEQGNKGATAIRLTFAPKPEEQMGVKTPNVTVLTFVNAHLAALDEMVDRRNVDFHELSRRLVFETRCLILAGERNFFFLST
jgi:phosphatidylinositol-bisphosphatase